MAEAEMPDWIQARVKQLDEDAAQALPAAGKGKKASANRQRRLMDWALAIEAEFNLNQARQNG